MKINKTFEQWIYVLIMLALQKENSSVKSNILSAILEVSDSYLKKILLKLVKANLIFSNASKTGGYKLAKPPEKITLYDVFLALESENDNLQFSWLAYKIFDNRTHIAESEKKVLSALDSAFSSFYKELKMVKISDLLEENAYKNSHIDWNKK